MIVFPFNKKKFIGIKKSFLLSWLLVFSQIAVAIGYVSEKIITSNK
jgi:hypothetical protein